MASARLLASVMAAGIIRTLVVAGVIGEGGHRPRGELAGRGRADLRHRIIDSQPAESGIRPASHRVARSGKGNGTPIARVQAFRAGSEAPSATFDPPASDGDLSLEVRWILPGALAPEMIEWFGPVPGGIETRRDTYLVSRTGPHMGVKVRGESQLDVKVYEGGPEDLTVPGRAKGRVGWWRKWSFPLRARDGVNEPAGWASVQKDRRVRFFSLAGRPITSKADAR